MRGTQPTVTSLPQAAAVLDLAMCGVHHEMGDDPFNWAGPAKAAPKQSAAESTPAAETSAPVVSSRPAPPPLTADSLPSKKVALPKVTAPEMEEIPARVWREGEKGDVVLVVQGEMPDARCQQLAKAMLAAVGLKEPAIAWVGCEGKVTAEALKAEIVAAEGTQTLIMGQGPLGVLMGKNLGVEGWHAADGADTFGLQGALGVTYPLDLLLKQPLFKRLAWQHLLAWGDHKNKNGV